MTSSELRLRAERTRSEKELLRCPVLVLSQPPTNHNARELGGRRRRARPRRSPHQLGRTRPRVLSNLGRRRELCKQPADHSVSIRRRARHPRSSFWPTGGVYACVCARVREYTACACVRARAHVRTHLCAIPHPSPTHRLQGGTALGVWEPVALGVKCAFAATLHSLSVSVRTAGKESAKGMEGTHAHGLELSDATAWFLLSTVVSATLLRTHSCTHALIHQHMTHSLVTIEGEV